MKRPVRHIARVGAFAMAASGLAVVPGGPASADDAPQPLPFEQDWSDATLITADDSWADVPGVVGYRGDGLASTGADPQDVVGEGAAPVVDVNADEANPSTFSTGGVAEFAIGDPVVALQGSGTADAPNLVVTLSTVGFVDVTVSYDARDIDGSADDAVQQLALQYRVGTSGDFTNVPDAYVADATQPNAATLVTPVQATLPPAADDQAVVQLRIITADASGSDEWVGIDEITVTGTPGEGGPASPVADCPAAVTVVEGDGGSFRVSATDEDSTIVDAELTSEPVDGITLTPTGPGAATLDIAPSTSPGTYPVTVTFTADDGEPVSCEITATVAAVTPISAIQGAGGTSPFDGRIVAVDAVVTTLFTSRDVPDGFFVQEEVGDQDDDAATSEGLFVFCREECPTVAAGDLVRLAGTVDEFFGMTQLDIRAPGSAEVVSHGNALPPSTAVTLPAGDSTRLPETFEPVEAMIVTFGGTLTVTEHFELARFGQIELTAGERPYQFTHDHAPDPAGYAAHLAELATRTIILDDDNNDQNDAVSDGPDEAYPYPTGGLSLGNDVRAGDTIADLTGVLHYSFAGVTGTDAWRLRPVPGVAYTFAETNPRPDDVEPVGGRLKVATFNVLNYFTTIDETSSSQTGPCGPSGTLDCRGADSAAELERQRAKEVAAIAALDADVVGLVELQNDDGTAVRDLVAGLNARPGAVPYAELPTGPIGTDAIRVAFIYRPSRVAPVGAFDILDSSDDPRFVDTRNRPALIQQWQEVATGERFTATVNHFKSKGSACVPPNDQNQPQDPDLGDGQGNCNVTRTLAAQALADHLAELVSEGWDPDVLILGDLNSYRNEDPITALEAAGYTDLIESFIGEEAYSYLFDGQLGYLDHALASASMAAQVTGVTEWHVNAEEVPLFDYNDTVRDAPGEAAFERESTVGELYAPDARRSSDHDPLVIGLELSSLVIGNAVIVQARGGGGTLVVSGTTNVVSPTCPTLALRVDATDVPIGPTTRRGRSDTCISLSSRGLVTYDMTTGAFAGVLSLPSSFRLSGDTVRFVLTVDGRTFAVDRDGRRMGAIWMASPS